MSELRPRWLPGIFAIGSLYTVLPLLALPALWHAPRTRQIELQMVFCIALALGGLGLLGLRRWGWALCAAGALMLVFIQGFAWYVSHQIPPLCLSFLNLVIFLYLVRPEVRTRLQ